METPELFLQSADKPKFRMVDVGTKPATRRRAIAQGEIVLASDAFRAVVDRTNPKGDVLALAEVAGIMAAKRASELIPLCHPLVLDSVRVYFKCESGKSSILVYCEAETVSKTGVEMEALTGVQGALLSIYDLSKAVNPAILIHNVRLNLKEGGKSGLWTHPEQQDERNRQAAQGTDRVLENVRVAVLTISDRCFEKTAADVSGTAVEESLVLMGGRIVFRSVVPDDKERIQAAVRQAALEQKAALVITTGGTGLGPRDTTPEALNELYDRKIPGIGELLRAKGASFTARSWLSRGEAGLVEKSLVVPLPGSTKACMQNIAVLAEIIPHALHILEGGGH